MKARAGPLVSVSVRGEGPTPDGAAGTGERTLPPSDRLPSSGRAVAVVLRWTLRRSIAIATLCGLQHADAQDVAAAVAAEIWRDALPRYRRELGSLRSYLSTCIHNRTCNQVKRLIADKRRRREVNAAAITHVVAAADPSIDRCVEELAAAIMRQPAAWLPDELAHALQVLLDAQQPGAGRRRSDVAAHLEISGSSLSRLVRQLDHAIRSIAQQEGL